MNEQTNQVDELAALALSPEHLRILRNYAQDTGSFRATNKQAADLAAACAAAIKLAEAVRP